MLVETITVGNCMGAFWRNARLTVDTTAPLHSGDVVRVKVAGAWIVKTLKVADDRQRWFLDCKDGVIPMSRFACVPDEIQKVIKRQCDLSLRRMNVEVPKADAHSVAIFKAFAEGVQFAPDGVAFPGISAALDAHPLPPDFDAKYRRARDGMTFATVPPPNPTKPSEPQSFALRTTAGTIEASWESPVVVPTGTRYRLIAAVNCGDASVGSVYWEGDAQRAMVPFISPTSGSWWWLQAYTGSYNSPYTPSTYGVAISPGFAASLTGAKIMPDGQFRSGVNMGSYWTGGSLPTSLSQTGGATDDTGKITCAGTVSYGGFPSWTRNISAARGPVGISGNPADTFAQCHAGQWINWYALGRRTTALVGSMNGANQAGFFVGFGLRHYVGGGATQLDVGSTFCRLDDKTVSAWQSFVGSVQVPNSLWEYCLPVLSFGAYAQSSGTLEVGRFDAYLT
jgi:hypothetical protein